MAYCLAEDKIVTTMRKTCKRRGPGRERNFVQENIVFLRELQTKLREKKTDETTIVRCIRKTHNKKSPKMRVPHVTHRKHAQSGKLSARKRKNVTRFVPYVADKNVTDLDIKLSKEETILLRGCISSVSQSSSDSLSSLSSTIQYQDKRGYKNIQTTRESEKKRQHSYAAGIVAAAARDDGTADEKQSFYKTSTICTENDSHSVVRVQETLRSTSMNKMKTVVRQNTTTSSSLGDLTGCSLNRRYNVTNQPCIKMTAKSIAAREKIRTSSSPDPFKPPPSYKKGVVPRYLQSHKKGQKKGDYEELSDSNSRQGYIPLPDYTRKEVLGLLRKNFADLTHELNRLPFRAPTIEMRERRKDTEKQLNKLTEAIQVFSQPEVSVKIALHTKRIKTG